MKATITVSLAALVLLVFSPFARADDQPVLSGNFLPSVLASSEPHRVSLTKVIKGRQRMPVWVKSMMTDSRYISLASEKVEVEGQPMQFFKTCEPRTCVDSEMRVLFSADGKHAVVLVRDKKRGEQFLGDPSAGEKEALER
ncbi:hypothetical protein ACO34A_08385 [Rhizobium sp. ACO-34A]|nr:Ivy family c-type lysozyme inhibitor [Rhizobium sp. ACO-34A]ATN33827.1 hypothetical protein ACO34A_08385 [Rhizobium sp. ACO-34A]